MACLQEEKDAQAAALDEPLQKEALRASDSEEATPDGPWPGSHAPGDTDSEAEDKSEEDKKPEESKESEEIKEPTPEKVPEGPRLRCALPNKCLWTMVCHVAPFLKVWLCVWVASTQRGRKMRCVRVRGARRRPPMHAALMPRLCQAYILSVQPAPPRTLSGGRDLPCSANACDVHAGSLSLQPAPLGFHEVFGSARGLCQ